MIAARSRKPPGKDVARDLPARVVTFLRVIGHSASIRSALEAGGYTAEEHAHGQQLLLAVCPYAAPGFSVTEDEAARASAAELLAWARASFYRLRAAMERLHPESAGFFATFDFSSEPEAVLACAQLFEWLAPLAPSAPVRVTLAKRGLDESEIARLRRVLATAQHAAPPAETVTSSGGSPSDVDPDAAITELYAWYKDWSATARSFVRRRDWLIRLGLARKRAGEDGEAEEAP